MDILVIFSFLIGGGLIVGLIAAVTRIPSARVIAGQNGDPGTARRVRRSDRTVGVRWALGAALVPLIFFDVTHFKSDAVTVGHPR